MSWKQYQERTKDEPPSPMLVQALRYVRQRNHALDFGAGGLKDSKYLVEQGFDRVLAVDGEFHVPHVNEHIQYIEGRFEESQFISEWFDLINAQAALPFIQLEHFPTMWNQLKESLVPGGIFVGQFFGMLSDPPIKGANYFAPDYVDILLSRYQVLKLKEKEFEEDGRHWHVYNFIVRKVIE